MSSRKNTAKKSPSGLGIEPSNERAESSEEKLSASTVENEISMQKNEIEHLDTLEGGKVAAILKKFGVKPPEFERFLSTVYSRASEKRHSASEIVSQCAKITSLEKKYGKSFDELKQDFEQIGKDISARTKELTRLDREIAEKQKGIAELEKRYADQSEEISAYGKLRAMGIDGKRILSWDKMIQNAKLDVQAIEAELMKQGELTSLEEQTNKRIDKLQTREEALKQSITQLAQEKENVGASIKAIKEIALKEVEALSLNVLSSITELNDKAKSSLALLTVQNEKTLNDLRKASQKEIKDAGQEAKIELNESISEIKSSASSYSKELKSILEQASPEIKLVSQALEAGERIGKYKTILPLLEMMEKGKGDEAEALIAIWNVSNRFNIWLGEHYGTQKPQIAEPLARLLFAVNEEIQRVGN